MVRRSIWSRQVVDFDITGVRLATLEFRPAALLRAREQAKLTQLQLAALAVAASQANTCGSAELTAVEQARRVRRWEGRIGAWERGVESPSASYIPTLARLLDLNPLDLYDIDPQAPPFTALRLAAGLTLDSLAKSTGIPYTSLHRMLRGVTELSAEAVEQLAAVLDATQEAVRAAIERDR